MFPKALDPLYIARTLTMGAAAAALFGTLWFVNGINAAPAQMALPLFAFLALLTLGITVACIRLFITAHAFTPSGDQQTIKLANRYVNSASVLQLVANVVASALLMLGGHADLVLPETVVTVGLYMLALAPLLRLPHYYVVGGLLTILPIVSVFSVPAIMVVGGEVLQSWTLINGIACGLAFLSLGCINLLTAACIRRGQHWLNRRFQALVVQL